MNVVLTTDQIFSDLKAIMAKLLKVSLEEINELASLESNLQEEIGIDSVESLDLLHALEARYSIAISDEEATKLKKVEDVIHLILSKRQAC